MTWPRRVSGVIHSSRAMSAVAIPVRSRQVTSRSRVVSSCRWSSRGATSERRAGSTSTAVRPTSPASLVARTSSHSPVAARVRATAGGPPAPRSARARAWAATSCTTTDASRRPSSTGPSRSIASGVADSTRPSSSRTSRAGPSARSSAQLSWRSSAVRMPWATCGDSRASSSTSSRENHARSARRVRQAWPHSTRPVRNTARSSSPKPAGP
ncbi:hypothetical protein [Ornithinimicrobium kibberense]|uniref:hypothetical protein n=1 Tax=Ornithinimicrobium kibberense TaxID=282060 RepID=UPI00361E62DF